MYRKIECLGFYKYLIRTVLGIYCWYMSRNILIGWNNVAKHSKRRQRKFYNKSWAWVVVVWMWEFNFFLNALEALDNTEGPECLLVPTGCLAARLIVVQHELYQNLQATPTVVTIDSMRFLTAHHPNWDTLRKDIQFIQLHGSYDACLNASLKEKVYMKIHTGKGSSHIATLFLIHTHLPCTQTHIS